MNKLVSIGTRGSALALWQARQVQNMLGTVGLKSELVPISSSGDKELQKPLYEMGVQGIFTKELDVALVEGQVVDHKSGAVGIIDDDVGCLGGVEIEFQPFWART